MSTLVPITVADPDAVLVAYGVGALVRVQSSPTETGAYADVTGAGSNAGATLAVAHGITAYTLYDPDGSATTWYRSRYEDALGVAPGAWSDPFPPGDPLQPYASLATFRTFVRNQSIDLGDDDADIELAALQAAARAIEAETGRTFTVTGAASARYFTAGWSSSSGRWTVEIDDVADTTGLTVMFDDSGNGDYNTASTAYRVGPANAASLSLPYTRLMFDTGVMPALCPDGVEVTARWGWTATPASIVAANLIQAARFLKRRDAAFGVAGSPELGSEIRLLSKLDPDVAVMVAPYAKPWKVP